MDTLIASEPTLHDPIAHDWTIAELIDWLGEDSRQHDDALRHPLARIEAELTGSPWAGVPSTVALIRSIAAAVRAAPDLGTIRISSLTQPPRAEPSALALSRPARRPLASLPAR